VVEYATAGATGVLYLAVTPDDAHNASNVTTTLLFELAVKSSLAILDDDVTVMGVVSGGEPQYYVYNMESAAALNVIVSFTVTSGDAVLLVDSTTNKSVDYRGMNEDNAVWVSYGTATLHLSPTDDHTCTAGSASDGQTCQYFAVVTGDAEYELRFALEGDSLALDTIGTPLADQVVGFHDYVFYYMLTTFPNVLHFFGSATVGEIQPASSLSPVSRCQRPDAFSPAPCSLCKPNPPPKTVCRLTVFAPSFHWAEPSSHPPD